MKKTITMNLSGIVFHIEEDAYEVLSNYLNTIKSYFRDSDGRDEIMADIESRIAELLSEKINTGKQAVLMSDVNEVIAQMGKPEDFAGEGTGSEKKEEGAAAETPGEGRRRRRVFRDPDGKIIGGVCSGIGSYFDIDPLWLRLGWVAVTLLGGAGILIYIIMWIVIPEARTTAEKLEMRGEPVNVNNIRKNIEEEMEHLKRKMKDIEKDAKNFGNSFKKKHAPEAADKLVDFSTSVFGSIIRAIGKFLAFMLIVVCAVIMVLFISSLFGFGDFGDISINELSDLLFVNTSQSDLALLGILLFIGVPLLMLIYGGARALFGIKGKNRIVSLTSSGFWVAGLLIIIFIGYNVANDFSEQSKVRNEQALAPAGCDTFYLRVRPDPRLEGEDSRFSHHVEDGYGFMDDGEMKLFYGIPRVDIQQSNDSLFHLVVTTYARGADKKAALERVKKISYEVAQTDSLLEFKPLFEIDKADKWRMQEVRVVLYVPRGKTVFLAKNMKEVIHDIENVTDTYDEEMVNRRWIMTGEGLACLDCEGIEDHRKKWKQIHSEDTSEGR
ncbi:MAG: PspC domain-containing protein [Bacteroidota bacterium]